MIQFQIESLRRAVIEHEGDILEVRVAVVPDERNIPRDEVTIIFKVAGETMIKTIPIKDRLEREVLERFFTRVSDQLQD